jgi:hypothetical protein
LLITNGPINQQPATINQQPATSNQQPAPGNQHPASIEAKTKVKVKFENTPYKTYKNTEDMVAS